MHVTLPKPPKTSKCPSPSDTEKSTWLDREEGRKAGTTNTSFPPIERKLVAMQARIPCCILAVCVPLFLCDRLRILACCNEVALGLFARFWDASAVTLDCFKVFLLLGDSLIASSVLQRSMEHPMCMLETLTVNRQLVSRTMLAPTFIRSQDYANPSECKHHATLPLWCGGYLQHQCSASFTQLCLIPFLTEPPRVREPGMEAPRPGATTKPSKKA